MSPEKKSHYMHFFAQMCCCLARLFTQTHCGDVSVNVIDPWCFGLVISASTSRLSISIHLQRHPANREGTQFASIRSKLFCPMVSLTSTIKQKQCGGTHRHAAGWQWTFLLLQEQIYPQPPRRACGQFSVNMYVFKKQCCLWDIRLGMFVLHNKIDKMAKRH